MMRSTKPSITTQLCVNTIYVTIAVQILLLTHGDILIPMTMVVITLLL